MKTIKALWHTSSDSTEWQEHTLANPMDPLLVHSKFSLISNGTERLVASGNVPTSAYKQMMVPYMQGGFDLPVHYGYSLVGTIANTKADQLVHLMHPHASGCSVSSGRTFPVPTAVPPARATLAANMETAVTAIWDSKVTLGDRVLIVGFGLVGTLVARLLESRSGAHVDVLDPDPVRATYAESLGFKRVNSPQADYDVAIHSSGTSKGLQTAIDALLKGGRVIELSWYGQKSVTLKLGSDFHYDRKQIISSQVGSISVSQSERWDFKRRKELVFDLLKDSWYDQLITLLDAEGAIQHFSKLRNGQSVPIAPVIDYSTIK